MRQLAGVLVLLGLILPAHAGAVVIIFHFKPSILFIPGIKGSELRQGPDTLWPPSFLSDDLSQLALDSEGKGEDGIKVIDVLDNFHGTPIYHNFLTYLDNLTTTHEITEYRTLPYDWRYSPQELIDHPEAHLWMQDPVELIEQMNDDGGPVIIVAHSMGGLLAKAIVKKLQEQGKDYLVSAVVMVGSPELGTPQATASLLHGDGEGILGSILVDRAKVRSLAQNFESAYDLLPSAEYFNRVTDPVVTFDPETSYTDDWRAAFGGALTTYADFIAFLTGGLVPRADPPLANTNLPTVLRGDLLAHAIHLHADYDNYQFPSDIRVVQVAGWGRPTVKSVTYTTRHLQQNYETEFTVEGDGMVTYPSAISTQNTETYFFNIFSYNKTSPLDIQHRNLLDSSVAQNIISSVVSDGTPTETQFLTHSKPLADNVGPSLIVSTHSPVVLGAYDSAGHFTGIDQSQDLTSPLLTVKEDIPGSSFITEGENQYIFLPKTNTYQIVFKGTGPGPATLETQDFANDSTSPIASYTDIPVTGTTNASLSLDPQNPADAKIQVDQNGDGATDLLVAPDSTAPTLDEVVTELESKINGLSIATSTKNVLLKKVAVLKTTIAKRRQKQLLLIGSLITYLKNHNDKIEAASAIELRTLVTNLVSSEFVVSLNPAILNDLRERVNTLPLASTIRQNLLDQIAKLAKTVSITRSLSALTETVNKRGAQGQLSGEAVNQLLNLLTQAQNLL